MLGPPCGPAIKAGKDGHDDEGSNKQSARKNLVVLGNPGTDDNAEGFIYRGPLAILAHCRTTTEHLQLLISWQSKTMSM